MDLYKSNPFFLLDLLLLDFMINLFLIGKREAATRGHVAVSAHVK